MEIAESWGQKLYPITLCKVGRGEGGTQIQLISDRTIKSEVRIYPIELTFIVYWQ